MSEKFRPDWKKTQKGKIVYNRPKRFWDYPRLIKMTNDYLEQWLIDMLIKQAQPLWDEIGLQLYLVSNFIQTWLKYIGNFSPEDFNNRLMMYHPDLPENPVVKTLVNWNKLQDTSNHVSV